MHGNFQLTNPILYSYQKYLPYHKMSPRSQNCIGSILIRRRPLYWSDIKIAQLGFGDVKLIYRTSNGRRRLGNGIPSHKEQNYIKSISMRHRWLHLANVGMPISTLIKMVYLRRLFRFRSRYLFAFELSTSFHQPYPIVADIKTKRWQNSIFISGLQIWISISISNGRRGISSKIYRYRSDIDCKIGYISPTWNGWRRFVSRITWYLYGYDIGCYIDPTWQWWYRKNIITAYFTSSVEARFLTSNGRYRVLSGIGSNLYHVVSVNTSVQHSVAIIETISKWCFSLKSDFPM